MTEQPPSNVLGALPDPLESPVSLKASLDASGIEGKAQSRAISALDSLIGSLIDAAGGAYLDGFRRRQRARNAIRERKLYDEGQEDLDDARLTRANARFERDLIEKQAAREAIGVAAIDQLKALPRPEQTDNESEHIDPDWMGAFAKFAEDTNSETLRRIWGRILAG